MNRQLSRPRSPSPLAQLISFKRPAAFRRPTTALALYECRYPPGYFPPLAANNMMDNCDQGRAMKGVIPTSADVTFDPPHPVLDVPQNAHMRECGQADSIEVRVST